MAGHACVAPTAVHMRGPQVNSGQGPEWDELRLVVGGVFGIGSVLVGGAHARRFWIARAQLCCGQKKGRSVVQSALDCFREEFDPAHAGSGR